MVTSEDIGLFRDHLGDLFGDYKLFYDALRRVKGIDAKSALVKKSEEYIQSENGRLEKLKSVYDTFSTQISQICDSFVSEVNSLEEENKIELEGLNSDFENMTGELTENNKELTNKSLLYDMEPTFIYRDNSASKMDAELVKKYPGCYMYREYMSNTRTTYGNVFIDCDSENDELIVKYMKDESMQEIISKMDTNKKIQLLDDLTFLGLPVKRDAICELGRNEDNKMMEAWRTRRVVMVNGKNAKTFNSLLKKNKLFDFLFANETLKNIHYYKENNTFFIDLKLKYLDLIEDYLSNDCAINVGLLNNYRHNGNDEEIIKEMKMLGIELNQGDRNLVSKYIDPRFLRGSTILRKTQYDKYLKKWIGNYDMKLVYRASNYGFKAESFHNFCDNLKGPSLVIIKSSEGWIFGGYTTQRWNGYSIFMKKLL